MTNLNKPLYQSWFNRMVSGIVSQGGGAGYFDEPTSRLVCQYRIGEPGDPDIRKCHIGLFIPDELYRPEMEGYGVGNGDIMAAIEKPLLAQEGLDDYDQYFLEKAQAAHDRSFIFRDNDYGTSRHWSWLEYRENMQEFGKRFDLDLSALDNIPV